MVAQRVFGIALGYEDLVDHDQLRHDPVLATLAGKLAARRKIARRSPARARSTGSSKRHRHRVVTTRSATTAAAIERLFVDLFLEAHKTPPEQIILDLDATDDPLHGHQEAGSSTVTHMRRLSVKCGRTDPGRTWSTGADRVSARNSYPARSRRPRTTIPRAGGQGQVRADGTTLRRGGMFQPNTRTITIHPVSGALGSGAREGVLLLQAGFMVAPVGMRPVVTKRHRATSSLRARATTAIRRSRPLVLPTRSQNQWLSALPG